MNTAAMKTHLPRRLRSALAVRYRVAVIVRGRCFNASGTDRRKLISLAQRTEDMSFWTLYKTGPLWLPEREVDSSLFTT